MQQPFDALVAAWGAGDAQALAAQFTEDGEQVVWNGMHLQGRAAIAQAHQRLFASIYKDTHLDFDVQAVHTLADGVGRLLARGRVANADGEQAGLDVLLAALLLRQPDGKWLIAALQNTPILDETQARQLTAGLARPVADA